MQDALGGDGRTLMLACCSPSSHHREETLNTLAFASRAKNIQNRPIVQTEGSGASLLQQMHQTIRALQEENASLRARVVPSPTQTSSVGTAPTSEVDNQQVRQTVAGAGVVAARAMATPQCATSAAGDVRPKPSVAALRAMEGNALAHQIFSGVARSDSATVSERDMAVQRAAALEKEVGNLRTTNELLRKSHEQVVRENQQLQAKLERLELIFESDAR